MTDINHSAQHAGQQLSDADQLRQLVAQYCRNVDDNRYDLVTGLFADHALVVMPGNVRAQGRTEIQALYDASAPLALKGIHCTVNHVISLDGDQGSVATDFFWINLDPAPQIQAAGRYVFKAVRESAGWRLQGLQVDFRTALAAMTGGASHLFKDA